MTKYEYYDQLQVLDATDLQKEKPGLKKLNIKPQSYKRKIKNESSYSNPL